VRCNSCRSGHVPRPARAPRSRRLLHDREPTTASAGRPGSPMQGADRRPRLPPRAQPHSLRVQTRTRRERGKPDPARENVGCLRPSLAIRVAARSAIDATARELGWTVPDWYTELKTHATPLLGSIDGMRHFACGVGLSDITVAGGPQRRSAQSRHEDANSGTSRSLGTRPRSTW